MRQQILLSEPAYILRAPITVEDVRLLCDDAAAQGMSDEHIEWLMSAVREFAENERYD